MAEGWRDGAAHGPKVEVGAHADRNRSRPERATACSGLWVVQTRNRVGMRWPQPSQGLGRPQTHKSVPGLPASGPAIAGARLPSFRAGKASCKGASCRVDWRGDQAFGSNRWRSRQSRESSASDDAGRVNFRVEPAEPERGLALQARQASSLTARGESGACGAFSHVNPERTASSGEAAAAAESGF